MMVVYVLKMVKCVGVMIVFNLVLMWLDFDLMMLVLVDVLILNEMEFIVLVNWLWIVGCIDFMEMVLYVLVLVVLYVLCCMFGLVMVIVIFGKKGCFVL